MKIVSKFILIIFIFECLVISKAFAFDNENIVENKLKDSIEVSNYNKENKQIKEETIDSSAENCYYEQEGINDNSVGVYNYVVDKENVIDRKVNNNDITSEDSTSIREQNKLKEYTGLIKIDNIWRMIINGKIDYNYTGIGTNEYGTWYLENGEINFKYTGSYKDSMNDTWIITQGKVEETNKLLKIDNIWRMIINGKIDYNYTGIGTNEYGTWYLENGEITLKYTGTYYEGEYAYIIEGSRVYEKVPKSYTGLLKINNTIWRMIVNGRIDYNYKGIGRNEYGTWYLENGEINFKYTGSYKDSMNDTWIITQGKVEETNKLLKIDNIWRMIVNGKIDYNYTGIGTNEYGTWYLENGEITLKYTGTYYEGEYAYIIEGSRVYEKVSKAYTGLLKINDTIWRMIINGKIDYNYKGIGRNEYGTWYFENGEINFKYTGKFTDFDDSIYNIVKGEVREVINNSLYPGTMWVDRPINGNNYRQGTLEISGWTLSESEGDIVKIYLDGKFCGNATRQSRPDVFEVYKDEYGGIDLNPLPGYYYKLNTVGLNNGKHIIKIVNLTKDGKTVIQSREVEFKIVNLAKTWGIDVSQFQENIDWNAVKNNGIDFAILRIGYYLESQGRLVVDQYFERNYNECKRLGIAIGGYFYSYAFNSTEALHEATACLSAINGKTFEMPIFLDMEDNILKNGVSSGQTNKNELTNAGITFCETMIGAGYRSGVYASKNFFRDYLNVSVLEKYNIWLAHYTSQTDYTGKFDIWQYTSMGSLLGINGNVDFNWCFTRYY